MVLDVYRCPIFCEFVHSSPFAAASCMVVITGIVWGLALVVVLPQIALQYPEQAQTIGSNIVSLR